MNEPDNHVNQGFVYEGSTAGAMYDQDYPRTPVMPLDPVGSGVGPQDGFDYSCMPIATVDANASYPCNMTYDTGPIDFGHDLEGLTPAPLEDASECDADMPTIVEREKPKEE